MNTSLYVGIYEGIETFIKPGIFTELHARMKNYSSGGNKMTIYGLCVCKAGLDFQIESMEEAGKNYFFPYRMRFNGIDRSEYLQYKTSPNNMPLLTLEMVINWYKEYSKNIRGLYWVKDEYLPVSSEDDNLKVFMENIRKNPKQYLQTSH